MDQIPRAVSAARNRLRGTTTLLFRDGRQGEYVMRGGVCWPMLSSAAQGQQLASGYMVLVGMDARAGRQQLTVFEEARFVAVDPVVELGRIVHVGISAWLNMAWRSYYADSFFYRQPEYTVTLWRKMLRESGSVQPMPRFLPINWDKSDDGIALCWRLSSEKRLDLPSVGGIKDEMTRLTGQPGATIDTMPALWALCACLTGFEQRRWRGNDEPYDDEQALQTFPEEQQP